jgi:hypothetical protein
MTQKNSVRFNQCKIINIKHSELQNKYTRKMRDIAMLLFRCGPFRHTIIFCTFEENWVPTMAKRRH